MIITVLVSKYYLNPAFPSSLPIPEFLNPPNGVVVFKLIQLFTQTCPVLSALLISNMLSISYENTPDTSPYSVLLALSITSAIVLNLKMFMTGPKISSWAMVMWSCTSENTVVSMK